MQDQSTDQNFDFEDFQEAPSMPRAKGYHPIVIGVGGALFGLILAVILIRGSMPEMSPEQIVAMEGYQGEQPPRYIFNLGSIEAANSVADRAEADYAPPRAKVLARPEAGADLATSNPRKDGGNSRSGVDGVVATADVSETQSDFAHTAGETMSAAQSNSIAALLAIETEEPTDTWPLEIVEVPASPIIVGKDAQEVAAPVVEEFDYRKLNRRSGLSPDKSDTGVSRMAVQRDQGETATTIRVLPVFTVNTDSAYVRAEPTQSSDIKLVLAKGTSVTAFEQSGAWVHVGANDGSSITGYMHQSKIAVTEIN